MSRATFSAPSIHCGSCVWLLERLWKLDPGIETVFLMADEEFSHVSSSLIKQITPLAGDEELARFIPRAIIPDVRAKITE